MSKSGHLKRLTLNAYQSWHCPISNFSGTKGCMPKNDLFGLTFLPN